MRARTHIFSRSSLVLVACRPTRTPASPPVPDPLLLFLFLSVTNKGHFPLDPPAPSLPAVRGPRELSADRGLSVLQRVAWTLVSARSSSVNPMPVRSRGAVRPQGGSLLRRRRGPEVTGRAPVGRWARPGRAMRFRSPPWGFGPRERRPSKATGAPSGPVFLGQS